MNKCKPKFPEKPEYPNKKFDELIKEMEKEDPSGIKKQ